MPFEDVASAAIVRLPRCAHRSGARRPRRRRRPATRGASIAANHRVQPPAVGRGGPGAPHRRRRRGDRGEQARDRRYNQQRNDAIERIDEALLARHRRRDARADAWHNSETAGAMIDRLSILALKIHHMRAQTLRADATAEHVAACAAKLARLALAARRPRALPRHTARACRRRTRILARLPPVQDVQRPDAQSVSVSADANRRESGASSGSSAHEARPSIRTVRNSRVAASRWRARGPSGAQRDAGAESQRVGEETQHAAGARRGEMHEARIRHDRSSAR